MTNRPTATLVALFLAALTLRPQIVGVGPLIPSIQDAFGTSHAVVGLLGTIPVLCMGLFAPVAAYLAAKIGTRRAMTIGLALIGRLRHPAGDDAVGLARRPPHLAGRDRDGARERARADLGQGALREPARDGHRRLHDGHPDRLDRAPQRSPSRSPAWLGGWRGALIAISCVALLSLVAWVVLTRGDAPHAAPAATVPRLPWRSRTAWLLVAIFALMGSAYYGLNAWLPDAYTERGWSDRSAGLLLAMMNLTAIPASFLIPWLSDRDRAAQPLPARAQPRASSRAGRARGRSRASPTRARCSPASPRAACSRS